MMERPQVDFYARYRRRPRLKTTKLFIYVGALLIGWPLILIGIDVALRLIAGGS